MSQKPKFVVLIGTSAGGFSALADLISQLTEEMDSAFFVVMHLSRQAIDGYLAGQMQKHTTLSCQEAEDGIEIKRGTIYFAHPNKHLIVDDDKIKLGSGPVENYWRPSIDVLFRSGAVSFKGYSIGLILTGMLDDGTLGMSAVKRCGGTCMVQDPGEAEYPGMPLSVLKQIEVDHCVPLSEVGSTLLNIMSSREIVNTEIPPDLILEVNLSKNGRGTIDDMQQLGKSSVFGCPDCGGVLFELDHDSGTRYKCHTGHSYTSQDLLSKQFKNIETSLWVALRSLEERRKFLSQLAEKNREKQKEEFIGIASHELKTPVTSIKG